MKSPPPKTRAAAGTEAPTAVDSETHKQDRSQTTKGPFILTEDHPLVDHIGTRRKEREAMRLLSILDELEGRTR